MRYGPSDEVVCVANLGFNCGGGEQEGEGQRSRREHFLLI